MKSTLSIFALLIASHLLGADGGIMNIQAGPSNQDLNKSMQNAQTLLQQKAIASQVAPAASHMIPGQPARIMMIDPTIRATDYKLAFEYLRREKVGSTVSFELTTGEKITNILDISLMTGGSLLIFKLNTSNGLAYKVVKIEDIAAILQS